ncbi:nucleoside kinase [Catonella massiliensis]|uniref:nucleoside kinase n=1 Tax=Catonella massiliensis TaxID=2799636 RepID=UPI001F2BE19B|nr:nucleoside kinase [Catonella massiliensis]
MVIKVDGKSLEYENAVKLSDIAKDVYGDDNGKLLAKVNGKLKELWKKVSEDAEIIFYNINSSDGARTYERGMLFLFIKSVHDVYDKSEVTGVNCEYSLGNGIFCEIIGNVKVDDEFALKVRERMDELVSEDIMFEKRTVSTSEAIDKFLNNDLSDKEHLFRYRRGSTTNIYRLGNYHDYFYGYMPSATGALKSFDLKTYDGGIVIALPNAGEGLEVKRPSWKPRELLYKTMKEANSWGKRLGIANVGNLNDTISEGRINDVMLVNEALQEGKIGKIAENIAKQQKKIVMIAGPSSSGKTTFSHRLSIELMVQGLKPHPIAADDYFKDREHTPKDENGEYDFECLEAIDVEQFNKDMTDLLAGKEVKMPSFNFKTGKREYKGKTLKLGDEDILVIEGIHGLNDKFSASLPKESKFKIYISALTQLNIDDHNRIHTTDLRLLRRMVRDARTRGSSAEDTLARWASVRRGEEKNIFPFQEGADEMFDSSLVYELAVLKQYAEPLLFGIPTDSPYYSEANRLLKFLDYFLTMPSDNVPKNSLVKEFIGGNCFPV